MKIVDQGRLLLVLERKVVAVVVAAVLKMQLRRLLPLLRHAFVLFLDFDERYDYHYW